jgi:hypothetical protein
MSLLSNTDDHCIRCKEISQWTHKDHPYAAAEKVYLLACGDIICQNCLTHTWLTTEPSGPILCPLCSEPAGFSEQPKEIRDVNRDTMEEAQAIVRTKSMAYADIGFELEDARKYLNQLYEMVLDQVLSEQDMGSPLFMDPKRGKCSNTFFDALYQRFNGNATSSASSIVFTSNQRYLITPVALENELRSLLDKALFEFANKYYGMALLRLGGGFANLDMEKKILELARSEMPEIKKLGDLWNEVAGLLVGFLALRHKERFVEVGEV